MSLGNAVQFFGAVNEVMTPEIWFFCRQDLITICCLPVFPPRSASRATPLQENPFGESGVENAPCTIRALANPPT